MTSAITMTATITIATIAPVLMTVFPPLDRHVRPQTSPRPSAGQGFGQSSPWRVACTTRSASCEAVAVSTGSVALLDAASLYFRSYFALPESMKAADGTPVNGVRGFADRVARILTDRRPARLVACLDADWRPQFRVDALPSYKAHRVAEEVEAGADVEEVP